MGGAVSSGESNDELIDNLMEADYIKTSKIEKVFRMVDRAFYYTPAYRVTAYKDMAWKHGNLHMSAPCIYSEVLENLQLESGMSFLNMGSGTGYLSTMAGLILGRCGVNHGIELYPDVVHYAKAKLLQFFKISPGVDVFDFCPPQFTVGNCFDLVPTHRIYDRIYCGAACPEDSIQKITDMLKVGGVCIVPINDALVQITKVSDSESQSKQLLPVSFAGLVKPKGAAKVPIKLHEKLEWNPLSLSELCRAEIRSVLRKALVGNEEAAEAAGTEVNRRKRRRRHQAFRRRNRLIVVERGGRHGPRDADHNEFLAIAYAMDERRAEERRILGLHPMARQRYLHPDESEPDEVSEQDLPSLDSDSDSDFMADSDDNGHACGCNPDAEVPSARSSSDAVASTVNSRNSSNGTSSVSPTGSNHRVLRREPFYRQGLPTRPVASTGSRRVEPRLLPSAIFNRIRQFGQSAGILEERRLENMVEENAEAVAEAAVEREAEAEAGVVNNHAHVENREAWQVSDEYNSSSSAESSDDDDDDDDDDNAPHSGRHRPNQNLSDSISEDYDPETDIGEEVSVPITHHVYLQMKERIEALPLPPRLKAYLNYNRN